MTPAGPWDEANQRYLMAAIAVVRSLVERRPDGPAEPDPAACRALTEAAGAMPHPPALDTIVRVMGLSAFERDVLVLCAGVELDAAFAASCAAAQGDPRRPHATFGLALAVLPGAHWSALAPASPLRRFRLVEAGAGDSLASRPLRVDEHVLHYLAGMAQVDERLAGVLEAAPPAPAELVPSHRAIASRVAGVFRQAEACAPAALVQLSGPPGEDKRAIAAAACVEVGLGLLVLPARVLGGADDATLGRLLAREAALQGAALLIDCDDEGALDASRAAAVARIVDETAGPVLVTSREGRRVSRRPSVLVDVDRPTAAEQRALWTVAAARVGAPSAVASAIDLVVSQFDLGAAGIDAACRAATLDADRRADPGRALWDACRAQARPRLDGLAARIAPAAAWDDLVLPEAHREVLREVAVHVRRRAKVYGAWGFGARGGRGLGVSALFAGPSGTGKTMAAEVLAGVLRLDLYRIDLSRVVSKYVGETEKNLSRVFDAAEEGAAILLFDEADALFGKRTEVKDSHDRYANIEVSYLLQRMEAYRGLSILTTNLEGALDTTFLRRIRFVLRFPFPDQAERAAIWRRAFPAATPTEGLDAEELSRLHAAGGNIRNIAMSAAFLAAEEGGPVTMDHVMRAARRELGKLEPAAAAGETEDGLTTRDRLVKRMKER